MHAFAAVLLAVVSASALQCNTSYPWYKWANNSNAQDPCQLVSAIRNSCTPDADPLPQLSYDPSGTNFYPGPNASEQNTCTCSYVVYNLMTACGDCQVGFSAPTVWPTYRVWAQSCDTVHTGGIYPNALPQNFASAIPVWARLSTKESGDSRWSYGLSHAIATGHVIVNTNLVASASSDCSSTSSSALPIGTAFAGLFVGLLIASLAFLFQHKRRSRIIPPPTRYHTAPDNTPLHPLLARPAYSQGTNFLRRMLEHDNENDPRRIEPFDISAATGPATFPPHPAVFPQRRVAFPPVLSMSSPSRGPSRQPSMASLSPDSYVQPSRLHHSRSQSHSKASSRPHTAASRFSSAGSSGAGPSMMPLQDLSPSEPPSPLPFSEPPWSDVLEDPPAYRRKS